MSDDQTKVLNNGDDKLDRIIELLRVQGLKIEGVEERLTTLEQKVDERLKDTRPLWEAVQAQITELREEMQTSFRRLDHKFDMLNRQFSELYADQRETEHRVDDLEKRIP